MRLMNNVKESGKNAALKGVLLMLAVLCLHGEVAAQERVSIPTVSPETHQRVLDLIFPRSASDFSNPAKEASLTLRFLPSFEAGSQINVAKYNDGRLEVITYTLPKRDQSIGEQLSEIVRQRGLEDAEELAKRLNVQKAVVTDTVKMRRLLNRFAAIRFSPQLDASITLDGTRFELFYETASNESYYALVGGEPGQDRKDHPIVRWMNEVRQAILK